MQDHQQPEIRAESSNPTETAPRGGNAPSLVTDTQRNGSIAGIAIVLGFSLSFTATWSQVDDPWRYRSLVVLAIAAVGIVLQLRAFFGVFSLPILSVEEYRRAAALFFRWVVAVLAGYALHIFLDAAIDLQFLSK